MNDIFLFFKQKTAYEKRISDWSSDVCSSDLLRIYDQATARSQILAKASKISPLSKARASNLYLLSRLHGPVVTTTLLLNLGALPFYNKLRHFVPGLKNASPLSYDTDRKEVG